MAITVNTISDTISTVYESSGDTVVTFFSITNQDSQAASVDVFVVPAGLTDESTIVDEATVLKDLEISASDTYQFFAGGEKLLLSDGDSIQAIANTISGVNCCISFTDV